MDTDELKALAMDFGQRMSDRDWLSDAILLAGMYPSMASRAGPGTRTIQEHVILIGPATEEPPPAKGIARSRRSDLDWLRVSPHRSGVMDREKFYDALSTRPLPVNGKELNFMAVFYTRRHGSGRVRFLFAHREEMDQPGAKEKTRGRRMGPSRLVRVARRNVRLPLTARW